MASFKGHILLTICRNFCNSLKPFSRISAILFQKRLSTKYLLIPSALFAECKATQCIDLQSPDPEKLTPPYLIKSATAQTADAVTTLLSQTACALIDAEKKYRETMEVLIQLLEYHLTVLGDKESEDKVWDVVMQGRSRVEAYEKHVKDLQLLFGSLEKLVDAAAEVAFIAGCEFTSTSLGERLHSAHRHVENSHKESAKVSSQLIVTQANCIKKIAEFSDKTKGKNKRKEEEKKEFVHENGIDKKNVIDDIFNEENNDDDEEYNENDKSNVS